MDGQLPEVSQSLGDKQRQLKQQLRVRLRALRKAQQHKDALSRDICHKLAELPEFVAAHTVMFYVDIRAEVRTQHFLTSLYRGDKAVVVPYCEDHYLQLFRVEATEELEPGALGILEPTPQWRRMPDRKVDIRQIDLIVVPGLVFDRRGGRIGRGKGYYDKLLRDAREDATLVGLAFDCQLVDDVPMQDHDVYMHKMVTESGVFERSR